MSENQEETVQTPVVDATQIIPAATPSVTPETTSTVTTTVQPTVIYCGPSLPRQYALPQYQIFNNGLPGHVQELVVKCSAIGNLIVPVDQLATTRIAIATQGSALASLYQNIVAAFAVKAVKK